MSRRLSLTTRLTLFYAVGSAIVLFVMEVIVSVAVQKHFDELDASTLNDKSHLLHQVVGQADSREDLVARLDIALPKHHDLHVRVADSTGATLYQHSPAASEAAEAGAQHPMPWPEATDSRSVSFVVYPSFASESGLTVDATLDTHQHGQFLAQLRDLLGLYLALAALLSGLLGWWATRRGLAPLREIKAKAREVTAQKLDRRMPVEAFPVEMADLAESLNDMLARLQSDFQRLSDFSTDLAHELRTPISNLLTQTQVALSLPRDAQAYREILGSNAEELERLARTVSDMLFLAKTENHLAPPHPERLAVEDEVRALFDFYEALAEDKGVRLRLQGEASWVGDRLMLRRALSNLLSNALRHTPVGGDVGVEIATQGGRVSICISNTGPQIPAEVLARLFSRFFRADKARSSLDSDGAGLGLAITRAIAEVHGGRVEAASADGVTRFTLHFPQPGAG